MGSLGADSIMALAGRGELMCREHNLVSVQEMEEEFYAQLGKLEAVFVEYLSELNSTTEK